MCACNNNEKQVVNLKELGKDHRHPLPPSLCGVVLHARARTHTPCPAPPNEDEKEEGDLRHQNMQVC